MEVRVVRGETLRCVDSVLLLQGVEATVAVDRRAWASVQIHDWVLALQRAQAEMRDERQVQQGENGMLGIIAVVHKHGERPCRSLTTIAAFSENAS